MAHRRLVMFSSLLALAFIVTEPGNAQAPVSKASPHSAKAAASADPPLIDLAGYQQLISKHRGKPLVVNFWATWCEPCRDEYPLIVELAKEFKSQGVTVLGIDMDDDSDMNLVRRFIAKNQPPFPNYRQKPGIDLDGFYNGVNPQWKGTMPQTIFYGRDGNIVGFFLGTRPRAEFEQAFRAMLATIANSTGSARSSGH
ncbi:MAG: TlpA disulfide reductase family protein [Candidatus Acidiferrales bacterium]